MMKQELQGLDWMTLPEAAPILKVSRVTVWRYVKKGKLKAVQFGNIYLVSERDVRMLAEARREDING